MRSVHPHKCHERGRNERRPPERGVSAVHVSTGDQCTAGRCSAHAAEIMPGPIPAFARWTAVVDRSLYNYDLTIPWTAGQNFEAEIYALSKEEGGPSRTFLRVKAHSVCRTALALPRPTATPALLIAVSPRTAHVTVRMLSQARSAPRCSFSPRCAPCCAPCSWSPGCAALGGRIATLTHRRRGCLSACCAHARRMTAAVRCESAEAKPKTAGARVEY